MRKLSADEVLGCVSQIEEHGYAILEDAIPVPLLDEIDGELARLERVRPGGDIPPLPFSGYVTRRWFDLLNDGEVWQRIAIHPWIMQVMPQVLGDGFLLSTMGSAVVGPGEKDQPLHVDDSVYQFPRPHPNLVCNTMWALSDFTIESGATRVVDGSNQWPHDPVDGEDYETTPLCMPRGSIAFVVGTCYHGAGANQTDVDRDALTINYCNGSMRQQENLMLAVGQARALTFPTALQDILGFKICKGAGHIFAQDPRTELESRFGPATGDADYLENRNQQHAQRRSARLAAEQASPQKG